MLASEGAAVSQKQAPLWSKLAKSTSSSCLACSNQDSSMINMVTKLPITRAVDARNINQELPLTVIRTQTDSPQQH
jgi:hypothetical protein